MEFLWHSPSEGSLSYPFTNYTHNTSYRPNARGGPSPYFSQSLELCVCRQANISQLGFPTTRLHAYLSPTWSALYCVYVRLHGQKCIANFLVCVVFLFGYLVTRQLA